MPFAIVVDVYAAVVCIETHDILARMQVALYHNGVWNKRGKVGDRVRTNKLPILVLCDLMRSAC